MNKSSSQSGSNPTLPTSPAAPPGSAAAILEERLETYPDFAVEVVVPKDDLRTVLAYVALLRKILAGTRLRSDSDGGAWIDYGDDPVSPDLTEAEAALAYAAMGGDS